MKTFKDIREAMSTWTVTVQKPVNKLKKGDKQVVKARSGFEAINKAMKLWKDPALKAASADSFKITKESIDEGKMKRNPAIDNNPDVKAARKAHADGTWDGNVDKEGEAIVHIKGKPYTVTNNNESVKEGKMKELQDYIDQGKSAEWIAKKIGYPVKDVKDFLKGYQKEDIDEGADPKVAKAIQGLNDLGNKMKGRDQKDVRRIEKLYRSGNNKVFQGAIRALDTDLRDQVKDIFDELGMVKNGVVI